VQPRGNHRLPLMVAAGAASGEPGQVPSTDMTCGKPISSSRFRWVLVHATGKAGWQTSERNWT